MAPHALSPPPANVATSSFKPSSSAIVGKTLPVNACESTSGGYISPISKVSPKSLVH